MQRTSVVSSGKWLIYWAIVLSTIFCLDLSLSRLNKFSPPDTLVIYIRQGIEYGLLNVLYLLWLFKNLNFRKLGNSSVLSFSEEEVQTNRPLAVPIPVGRSLKTQVLIPSLAVPQATERRDKFSHILKVTAIFLAFAYISYPHKITDVYIYLQYGLMVWHQHNPYTTALGDFNSQLVPMLDWLRSTCAYGPISLLSFVVAAAFVPFSTVLGIYALKLIYLALHLFNGYLVWSIADTARHRSLLTISYLTCPILLFEQICNVHVDIFGCTAALLLIRSLKGKQFVGSIAAIWFGILSRTIPLIWLPLVSVSLSKNDRWNSLFQGALLSIGLIVIFSLTIFKPPATWLSLLNSGTSWQTAGSIHNLFLSLIEAGQKAAPNLISTRIRNIGFVGFKLLLYAGYCGYYAGLVWKCFSRRSYPTFSLITDLGWATLALLLLAVPWYQPWYASTLFPFILFTNSHFFRIVALTFAVTGSCSYYILTFDPSAGLALQLVSVFTVLPTATLLLFRRRFSSFQRMLPQ